MNDKEYYFENISDIGNLAIEHVFYEYDEPILFVCKDDEGRRYICSCCDLSRQWVVSPTSEEDLIQMIDDNVSLEDMFVISKTRVISWDNGELSVRAYDPDTDDLLPRHGAVLDLPVERTADYRSSLSQPFRYFWRLLCDWGKEQVWKEAASEFASRGLSFLHDGVKGSFGLNECGSFALPTSSTFSTQNTDFPQIQITITLQSNHAHQCEDVRQNMQDFDYSAA